MSAAATPCERCGRATLTGSAVYSTAGELLCQECASAVQTGELEARGTASRRNARIVLGAVIALVVLVPAAMFAAGLGQKIGEALLVLGVGLMLGPLLVWRLWIRMLPLRFAGYMLAGGLVVAAAGGGIRWLAEKYRPERLERQQAAAKAEEQRALAEEKRAAKQRAVDEEEKQRVENGPLQYLEASDFGYADPGAVTAQSALDRLTILNKSRFPLWKIAGEIDWMDGAEKVGSAGFTIKATIAGGQWKPVSKEGGTLESDPVQMSAGKTKAKFTQAVVKFTQAVVYE